VASDLSDLSTEANDITKPDVSPIDRPTLPAIPPQQHRFRFGILYALLAGVLGVAVAGIALYATDSINPSAAWSSWTPGGGGLGRESQIAAHVAKEYHLPSGAQLVEVFAKPPSVSPADQQIPLHYIVVQHANSNDAPIQIDSDNTVQYSLCGLGDSCAIATGTPSVQRGTLVRREILELALYTFKYMGNVKQVIAFMPPTPGSTPKYVVLLQRDDLDSYLSKPLEQTLDKKTPLPNSITRTEQQTIDATTESRVYSFGLSQAQNGDAVLVLTPIPA
jgi:hypothetical protein